MQCHLCPVIQQFTKLFLAQYRILIYNLSLVPLQSSRDALNSATHKIALSLIILFLAWFIHIMNIFDELFEERE